MLGKIENHRRIAKLTDIVRLAAFAKGVVQYLHKRVPDDAPAYPTHRTADEKRLLRNKRARIATKKRKTT